MIEITGEAINHIKKMLAKNNGIGFRLSVKKTGCSGYSYVPEIVQQVRTEDIHCVYADLNLYLEKANEYFFKNLKIDYAAGPEGLNQKKLIFINPNEKNKCGCGESFMM